MSDANLDLIADNVDLAIRLAPAPSGDLISSRLMATRYHVCASPDYLARVGAPAGPADLAGHGCLLLTLPDFRTR